MENLIQIQQEFETLISELEKLKNINQITASNAENAEKTINEIESFILSVKSFNRTVEDDYEIKKKSIENVLRSLEESFNNINKNTEKHSEEFSEILKNFSNKFVADTTKTQYQLLKQIDDFNAKLDNQEQIINNKSSDIITSIHNKINKSNTIQIIFGVIILIFLSIILYMQF